jgi:hypothetical protein
MNMLRKIVSTTLFVLLFIISSNATEFKGWFLLLEFEPVYNHHHYKSKVSATRLYFIKDVSVYLNDSVDYHCFMPKGIVRLMNIWSEGPNNSFETINKKKEIVKKRFGVEETDSLFTLHYRSHVDFNDSLRNNCCEGLKKDESRKLHFFYGKMEGEYYDEYRELFCDDYLKYIPRYVFFSLEECNKLEYRFSIVLPPPSRILRFYEDFKNRE